jgi:hypothetical protein
MDSIKNRRNTKDSITLQWTPLKIEGLLRTQSPYNGFKKESNINGCIPFKDSINGWILPRIQPFYNGFRKNFNCVMDGFYKGNRLLRKIMD